MKKNILKLCGGRDIFLFRFYHLIFSLFCGGLFLLGFLLGGLSYENTWIFWMKISILYLSLCSLFLGFYFWLRKKIKRECQNINGYLQGLMYKDCVFRIDENFFIPEFSDVLKTIKKLSNILEKERNTQKNSKKLRLKYLQSSSIISALSHEFKNPLAVISGYCNTMIESEDTLSEEQKNRFLGKIYTQSHRLNDLLNRINLAVRLENELIKVQLSSFNLKPLIEEIISHLTPYYPHKQVITDLRDTIFFADKALIERAVSNLIENALKYCKNKIKIVLKKNKFKVIDDGEGIEEKQIALITKKFYRIEKKHQENSLGIGLFVVKYILKLHHSELKIKSRKGKGSTFSFKLI